MKYRKLKNEEIPLCSGDNCPCTGCAVNYEEIRTEMPEGKLPPVQLYGAEAQHYFFYYIRQAVLPAAWEG
jgi:hypothetical protein